MMCMVPECRSSECVPPLALSCSASLFFSVVQTRAASSLMPAPAMINMTSSAEQAWLSLTTCLVSETVRCSGRRALLISSTPGPFFCRFGKGCMSPPSPRPCPAATAIPPSKRTFVSNSTSLRHSNQGLSHRTPVTRGKRRECFVANVFVSTNRKSAFTVSTTEFSGASIHTSGVSPAAPVVAYTGGAPFRAPLVAATMCGPNLSLSRCITAALMPVPTFAKVKTRVGSFLGFFGPSSSSSS
mmetsp:Transcript_445/g.1736  ORF Transcript_445/g.1736 Transcript_445/m.1736 type:complete len:242 (-) Transcript_445:717-1442(-)